MLKERVAYLAFFLYLFGAVNKSLAQSSYPAYSSIEVHTLRDISAGDKAREEKSSNWNIGFLSQPKLGLKSAQSGNKALFASQTQCEIYDFDNQKWQVKPLSKPRRGISIVSSGNITYLAGGCTGPVDNPRFTSKIDIYNSIDDKWNTGKLSQPRVAGACVATQGKIIFAGGISEKGLSDIVDIFDVQNHTHQVVRLSAAKTDIEIATAGNKVLFAGGVTADHKVSTTVDMLDLSTGKWTTGKLSAGRKDMAVATAGNFILFAGGQNENGSCSNVVDIYNTVTGAWQAARLNEAKKGITAATAGGNIYFAGGITGNSTLSNEVDIYNTITGTWGMHRFDVPRLGMAVGVTPHKLLFAGGAEHEEDIATDRIEILDIETGEWSVEHLYQPRTGLASASYNGKIIFAGGTMSSYPFPEYKKASGVVDIYTDPSVTLVSTPAAGELPCLHSDEKTVVYLDLRRYRNCVVDVTVLDAARNVLFSAPVAPSKYQLQEIDVTAIPAGNYQLVAEAPGYHPVMRSFTIQGADKEQDSQPKEIYASLR